MPFHRYAEMDASVEIDAPVVIADEVVSIEEAEVFPVEMDAEDNPLTALNDILDSSITQEPATPSGKRVALIDTGAADTANVVARYSVLGDDVDDGNGHGTAMAAQIVSINEFVEKIVVHERDRKGCVQTTQKVDIYFNFIGNFVPPDFALQTPEEIKAMEEMEALRQKRHEAYLKAKANGTYKRYADKVKAQKKAEMDAKKDAIRQEDMKNGVFTPVAKLPKLEPQRAAANY